jgi:hypothetical protein
MEPDQRNKTNEYLDQLLTATRSSIIRWDEANPTTFTWTNLEKGARIILQNVGSLPTINEGGQLTMRRRYLMQVVDTSGRQQLVLQGAEDEGINAKLDSLYENIQASKTKSAIDYLGSIIPKS